ncbi:hypothetical protein ACNJD8_21950, partial [Mycobacterium tuberculosis]
SVIRCRGRMTPAVASALPGAREAATEGAELRIVSSDAAATVRALLDDDPTLSALRVADATLEDAIAALLAPDRRIAA